MTERFRLPEAASADEAAAIAAALDAYLDSDADEESTGPWDDAKWSFTGRAMAIEGRRLQVPNGAPADRWAAMGRADRF